MVATLRRWTGSPVRADARPARRRQLLTALSAAPGVSVVVLFLLVPSTMVKTALLAGAGVLSLVAVVVGVLLHRPRPAPPWWLLAVSGAFFLAGVAVRPWSLAHTGPATYLVDALSLTGYAALLTSLFWLARSHGGMRREVLCDVVIIGATGALAALQHLVLPAALIAGRPLATSVLAGVYPLVDVLLVSLVLDVVFSTPGRRSYHLLAAAVVALLVGDTVYAWWGTKGALLLPTSANLPFLASYLLIAAAALHPSQRGVPHRATAPAVSGGRSVFDAWSWPRLIVLGISLAGLVALITARPVDAPLVNRWSAATAVAVVLTLLVVRAVSAVNGQARARAVLAHRASHDALTDLPDREELRRLVDQRCARRGPRAGEQHWLLYLDLDGFKRINDSWGHAAGDELLREVSRRLQLVGGPQATVARLSGDEFVLVVTCGDAQVARLAEDLLREVAQPVHLSVTDAVVTASIGVAAVHGGAQTALREADAAMYQAKRAGRHQWLLYDETMRNDQGAAIELELDLRHAVDEDALDLAYQLIVAIDDARPVGTEALLRWERPLAGPVSPVVFVPILEETGLIEPVGLWALRRALRQLARWRREDLVDDAFTMSVNVAPRQLLDPRFTERVAALLQESGVAGTNLVLEITESAMLTEADAATLNLAALRGLGVGLAVDDFGTGYSALSYLRTLPVTRVKIDRSFVSGLGDSRNDEALVRAVVAVSHALGLGVTAEGIETPAQHEVLRRLGVGHGQGWLWAKAAAPDDVSRALALHRRSGSRDALVPGTAAAE
ncbi:putative bifunctional diguanylate cyclase/phosphodiesterase [Kineococcus rubinsiae]|uniref:putative bifunctional diguanylate cyclase/phosphodiesterase n=1 Tax=Kineococcus rubinsiae TaxID=2609562 RepID=UPI001AD9161B|nr:bifunctional diguanylate cyclase/phosphodiesterase [Kineococcus rubinsiae]